jgi:hypothetical protein
MICSVLIVISSVVRALATIGLTIVSFSNLSLARSIRCRTEQREQEMKDLLQAVVLALMLAPHGGESVQSAVIRFKNAYKGKMPII